MSTSTRVIKNTGYLYVKMFITVFISLYITRLILASLGASDFGIYNIVGSAIALLDVLNNTMQNVTQRYMSYALGANDLEQEKKVFNVCLVIHVSIAIITALILLAMMPVFFGGFLNIPDNRVPAAKVIYLCVIVSTALTIINVPYSSIMNAHENMLYYSVVGVIEVLLNLAVALFVVYTSGDKLITYGILMMFVPMITLTIMKVYCHRKYEECIISPRKYWDKALIKDISKFFSWNFLTAISSMLSFYGIGIALNQFYGTVLNAAQGIANQVNAKMTSFSNNLMKAVNPIITKRAGANDLDSMNRASIAGAKYSTLLIILFAVPCMLEIHYILNIWLKEVPEWTATFCCLQIIITIVCQLAGSIATGIYAQGNIKWYAIWKSVMNIAPIILTYIAFEYGGAPFWMYVFMILVWGIGGDIVIVYYSKKLCNLTVSSFFKDLTIPVIAVMTLMVAVGFMSVLTIKESFLRLCITCAITTIVFAISNWCFVLNNNEKSIIRSIARDKILSKVRK